MIDLLKYKSEVNEHNTEDALLQVINMSICTF